MRSGKWYFLHTILLTATIGGLMGSGCRKENGIVNNNVIRTPYSLYFSDQLGALYNTNDGKAFKMVFPTDGYKPRTVITTSGPNIIWVKNNVHTSADNGRNFNPTNFTATPFANSQSMILDVPSHGRVYLASTAGNFIQYSENHGVTWQNDSYNGTVAGGIEGFTQLRNGEVYAIDNSGPKLFVKKPPVAWTEVTGVATPLVPGNYILSHFNNALVAADVNGAGIYHSNNGGLDWNSYPGMPLNQEIRAVAAPLDQVLLAGSDSAGIYRLVGNSFVPSNNGLEPFTTVYGIVGKQDTYKNDVVRQFVYIATNKGLFRSEDLGQNWTLVRPGDIRAVY